MSDRHRSDARTAERRRGLESAFAPTVLGFFVPGLFLPLLLAAAGLLPSARAAAPTAPPSAGKDAASAGSPEAGAGPPPHGAPSGAPAGPPSCAVVAAGNLDGEGDDEIVCWSLGRISFWQSAAHGLREVYPAHGKEDAIPLGAPARVLVADLDGDGRDDALFGFGAAKGAGNAPVELIAVRIKGKVADRHRISTTLYRAQPERPLVTGLEQADLDGDGKPEILLAHFDDRYHVVAFALSRLAGADPLGGILPARPLGRIRMATSWAAGRLAGEPSPAVVVGRAYGEEAAAPGDLFFLKSEERVQVPTQLGVHSVAIGDGDGDGKSEIYFGDGWHREFAAKARGRLSVAHRRPDGAWSSELIEDTAGQYEIGKIVIGDFDGDGKPEILAAGNVYVSLFWWTGASWMTRKLADGVDFTVARQGGRRMLVLPGEPIRLLALKDAKAGGRPVAPAAPPSPPAPSPAPPPP